MLPVFYTSTKVEALLRIMETTHVKPLLRMLLILTRKSWKFYVSFTEFAPFLELYLQYNKYMQYANNILKRLSS